MSEIVFNPPSKVKPSEENLSSQIENLQTTLASLNQQVITLQEALQERDQEIADLQSKLFQCNQENQALSLQSGVTVQPVRRIDDTLTIIGALIMLYQFIVSPGKEFSA